ncbi:MAG: hypothetical protein V4735_02580 [Pseudomonadota bacterium]
MLTATQFSPQHVYALNATIPSGATLSNAIDLSGTQLAGMFIPASFDGTLIYLQAAPSLDGTYSRVQADGTDVAITVTAGKAVAISNLAVIVGWQFIKLETLAAQATTDTVITLATRPL